MRMRGNKWLGTLGGMLVLGGAGSCTKVGPAYQRPALEVPEAYRGIAATQAAAGHLATNWWELFKDADLDALNAELDDLCRGVPSLAFSEIFFKTLAFMWSDKHVDY